MTSGGLSAENGLNLTKVILGFITIVYDVLFCIQHYCLFRNSEEENDQKLIDDSNGILETVDGPLSGSGTKWFVLSSWKTIINNAGVNFFLKFSSSP